MVCMYQYVLITIMFNKILNYILWRIIIIKFVQLLLQVYLFHQSPRKLITPIQIPIASQNVSPRINDINESPVLDCFKINETSNCSVIHNLLIVEKAENNVSHIRLMDRTDNIIVTCWKVILKKLV